MKRLTGEIVEGVAKSGVELTASDVFDPSNVAQATATARETGRKGKVLVRC